MPYSDPERQKQAQREWVARRRREFFAGKTCLWCGSSDDLRLHHRDPSRKVSHRIWSWSAARRDAEVAKCDVLCEACHGRAHAEARRVEAELRHPHGTHQRYSLGCKCVLCRRGKAEYNQALRERAA